MGKTLEQPLFKNRILKRPINIKRSSTSVVKETLKKKIHNKIYSSVRIHKWERAVEFNHRPACGPTPSIHPQLPPCATCHLVNDSWIGQFPVHQDKSSDHTVRCHLIVRLPYTCLHIESQILSLSRGRTVPGHGWHWSADHTLSSTDL